MTASKLAFLQLVRIGCTMDRRPVALRERLSGDLHSHGSLHLCLSVASDDPTCEHVLVLDAAREIVALNADITHVMVLPEGASLDEGGLRAPIAEELVRNAPDRVVLAASSCLFGRLLLHDGRPDARGRCARDSIAEAALREEAQRQMASGRDPQQIYADVKREADRLNVRLGDEPSEPLPWWRVSGVVGHVYPVPLLLEIGFWARYNADTSLGTLDEVARIYLDLHPEISVLDDGPRRTSAWSSVLDVPATEWNLEATYRVARGGARVDARPSVAILTPGYGGMHSRHVGSLLRVVKDLHDHQIPVQTILSEGESLVTRARHNLVHLFLLSTCTHMLFWDADLELLDPTVVRKMLAADKPVVGGAYPFRDGSGRLVVNFLEEDPDGTPLPLGTHEERVANLAVDETGCAEVRHVPTGFLLVRRGVITELYEAHPELMYLDTSFQPEMRGSPRWDVFGTAIMGRNYLSEDWAFCERWRALADPGRPDERRAWLPEKIDPERYKVHVFVDADFVHHGTNGSTGSLRSKLRRKESST